MPIPTGHRSIRKPPASAVAALCLLLAACGDDDATVGAGADTEPGQVSGLPAPEGATGSVTGMPANPGPGTTPITRAVDAPSDDVAVAIEGGVTVDQATPVEGVFVLSDAPLLPAPPASPAPQSPAEPRAAFVQPADGGPGAPPAGTEAATESTTFVVEPAEPDD